jgi:hypothetical protein
MDQFIYVASDGTAMSREDFETYLCWSKCPESGYGSMTFDDLTGGITEFLHAEYYYEMKHFYEHYIDIQCNTML